jgi:hypothetical protein
MVIFAMGLAPLPAIELYWKKPKDMGGLYGNAFIANTLSRDEFWTISKILHCDIEATVEKLNLKYRR